MSISLPTISIITPSYNQELYIEQTIQSVLSQNYPNLEYIVIDGGSTDNTLSILKKYENKLNWISEKDSGQSNAINKGLRMASGDVVAWLNSDDYYLPGTLATVGTYFAEHSSAQWVTGDYTIVNEQGNEIQSFVRHYKNVLRAIPFKTALFVANYINQPSTFWRRTAMEEVGYINESYHLCMDYDYWLRLYRCYPLHRIAAPLSAFRIHADSKGKNLFIKQFQEEREVAAKNGANTFELFLHSIHSRLVTCIYNVIK
jgi:cellulose synthase/poly-beta-1,6-N-acetylglucosamine synthase-like glycosyltransferase